MRLAGFALVVGLAGWGEGCKGETIAPLRPLGEGVPADLPALGADDFATIRLIING